MSSWTNKLAGLAPQLKAHAEKACQQQMAKNPVITDIKVKGTKLHQSHDGSGKQVISIQLLNDKQARVETLHVEADGTAEVKKKDR